MKKSILALSLLGSLCLAAPSHSPKDFVVAQGASFSCHFGDKAIPEVNGQISCVVAQNVKDARGTVLIKKGTALHGVYQIVSDMTPNMSKMVIAWQEAGKKPKHEHKGVSANNVASDPCFINQMPNFVSVVDNVLVNAPTMQALKSGKPSPMLFDAKILNQIVSAVSSFKTSHSSHQEPQVKDFQIFSMHPIVVAKTEIKGTPSAQKIFGVSHL
ncbi:MULTISPECIES: hypothetical protein [Helicobacter]|uniref:hypothetical protein n=1 Tax=Helicobacter TaxID=209 RepID=UPI000EB4D7A8|nr:MULTISPECIES: hypothetical protein [Helicobacter]